MIGAPKTLRSKFVLAAALGVLAGLLASMLVSLRGVRLLGQRSSLEIERGLELTSRGYLETQLEAVSRATESILQPARVALDLAADMTQELVDREQQLAPFLAEMERQDLFGHGVVLETAGNYRRSSPGSQSSLGFWSNMLDSRGDVASAAREVRRRTLLLDLILPPIPRDAKGVLQVYFVGPKTAPFMHMAPYLDAPGTMERLYPGSSRQNFWDFFFPGVVETWVELARDPARFAREQNSQVFTLPYEDAAGGGPVLTKFRPIWTRERRDVAGALGIDVTLSNIIQTIESVRLSQTGFAFLVSGSGDVLAINERGARTLGLKISDSGKGVKFLHRRLADSTVPAVTKLTEALGQATVATHRSLDIDGKPHLVLLREHAVFDSWVGQQGFEPVRWTVGLVVPRSELFASVAASQRIIEKTNSSIVLQQSAITLATLVAVVLAIAFIARRMTAPLTALTQAARTLEQRRYAVPVNVASNDEVGELAAAFGTMAGKIREHTTNLEQLVEERTEKLNKTLSELWSEVSLAQKIQTVLLPEDTVRGDYDFAARMVPASEVGGDYYDVFSDSRGHWALIGDVSGHGVTAGLIMMMAQTATRTAALVQPIEDTIASPAVLLGTVNEAIRSNLARIGRGQYMTISAFRIEGSRVMYAGLHQDILVYRHARRVVERFPTSGIWLGLVDDVRPLLENAEFELEAGDVLLLYTDGLTEAKVDNRRIEIDGLERALASVAPMVSSSRAIVDRIFETLGVARFEDDATLMAIRRSPSNRNELR